MSSDTPESVSSAFEAHEAFEAADSGYLLTTTVFDPTVEAVTEGAKARYTVTVCVPTLDAATEEDIGEVLAESWQETLTRRLEEAPKATRSRVDLDGFGVEAVSEELRIEYIFTWGNPTRAVEIAKTFAEYVEGTYVEGIVPGYDYEPPISSLLADASQSGEGGTPL
jgi:hypothetical protein